MKKFLICFTILIIVCCVIISAIYRNYLVEETDKTNFPKTFDTLVIDHFDYQWAIKRNDKIDGFIEKSKRVSKHTGEGTDYYILRFYSNAKEVYSIVYDETGYPESAVRIMNELMKANRKEKK